MIAEAHSEPIQIPKMELFAKIVNTSTFAKSSILHVSLGFEYAS